MARLSEKVENSSHSGDTPRVYMRSGATCGCSSAKQRRASLTLNTIDATTRGLQRFVNIREAVSGRVGFELKAGD